MVDLDSLTDSLLLNTTDKLVKEERDLLVEILRHLCEIERRRLFASLGYKSLFEYAVKRLKYSEDQAGRRIAAMRLLKELPEIEEKIENGALTLSHIGLAQSLFRHEGMAKADKIQVLARLENTSKREAEKIVLSQAADPISLKPDQIKPVTETKVEIKFIADQGLVGKIEKLKGLLAHSHPNMTMAELVEKLCDMGLSKLDPSPAPARRKSDTPSGNRREVWRRAGSKCQNCGSRHALQVDHIQPKALGGGDEIENLRLLCRSCNQRAAIEKLGLHQMQRYLERSHNLSPRCRETSLPISSYTV